MMSFYNLTQKINQQVEEFLSESCTQTTAKDLGIDERSCWTIWRCHDCVVIRRTDKNRFDYYAGGEYVDNDCVNIMGDYVFYSADDERVAGWLGLYQEEHEDV